MPALDDFWAHDPFILPDRERGEYLLYTTLRGTTSVGVRTSADLVTWSEPRTVFTVPEGAWADASSAPWAPEVHAFGGRYALFSTLHDPTTALPAARSGSTVFRLEDPSGAASYAPSVRGTAVAVSDSPLGPFELVDPSGPVVPSSSMTLDGTLFVDDDGRPWMVYAHEWVQTIDGTIEAIPLDDGLRAAGDPIHLFRGSEAAFLRELVPGTGSLAPYVTDGPQLRRLPGGALGMIWATYRRHGDAAEYVEVQAISRSGSLRGPWEQGDVLVDGNAGHGMLFETFEGRLRIVLHRGMGTPRVRAEIHAVLEDEDGFRLSPL